MWLIDALIALVLAVLAHSVLCRVSLPLNSVTRFLMSGAVVGACLVWWLIYRYGATASQTWAATLMFAFGCELYLFLFTMAMTSVAANLLANLARRDMTDADIEQLYESRDMVAARLDRLVAAGLLADSPAGLQLTAEGQRMVSIFRRLRGFFRHPLPAQDLAAND
jgi:hypothetical protein